MTPVAKIPFFLIQNGFWLINAVCLGQGGGAGRGEGIEYGCSFLRQGLSVLQYGDCWGLNRRIRQKP